MANHPTVHNVGGFDNEALLDVIFIHGLGGSCFDTWSNNGQEDGYWPQWLADEFPESNILTVNYNTPYINSFLSGAGLTIIEQATQVLEILVNHRIGDRPIVFVTHSLGGIVAKDILKIASDGTNSRYRSLRDCVVGVVFIGTPHNGSRIANFEKLVPGINASNIVDGLKTTDDHLYELGNWFRDNGSFLSESILVYTEKARTHGVLIVDKHSSNPGIPGVTPIVLEGNHIDIAKPESPSSTLYLGVSALINKLKRAEEIRRVPAPDDADDLVSIDPDCPMAKDFQIYTNPVSEDDRLTLEDKLKISGRSHEIPDALVDKHDFSMIVNKNNLQGKPRQIMGSLLSDMHQRYKDMVYPHILKGDELGLQNHAIHDYVIHPILEQYGDNEYKPLTKRYIKGALYYLGGHCHVRWHVQKKDEEDNG